jgi:hypothetical protein
MQLPRLTDLSLSVDIAEAYDNHWYGDLSKVDSWLCDAIARFEAENGPQRFTISDSW